MTLRTLLERYHRLEELTTSLNTEAARLVERWYPYTVIFMFIAVRISNLTASRNIYT
jgi:hypothetical protein